jgi:hypothetical protein
MKLRLIVALLAAAASAVAQNAASVNETARFLAGLAVTGPLETLTRNGTWTSYAASLDAAWLKKEAGQLSPIRAWMNGNAPQYYRSSATMFYMFSGPDILYAHTFFPNARTYILCGTEPVGSVPDLAATSPDIVLDSLGGMRQSLSSILRFHYFITKDMRADLSRSRLGGTVPLIYIFLARMGCTVLDTEYVRSPAQGVRIRFKQGGGVQTVYYFKTDLSNGGGSAGFLQWCAAQGPGSSLVKAASYLMHGDGFSNVRSFLLQNSRVIIQDDSGIPLRAFTRDWTVRHYGNYVPGGETFGKYYQRDLAAVYAANPPQELGFAFGYHWQVDRGMLMLATRK